VSTTAQVKKVAPAAPVIAFAPPQTKPLSRQQRPLVTQPPLIQFKLSIGLPGDRYEQEADRIADQVMRIPEPGLQRQLN